MNALKEAIHRKRSEMASDYGKHLMVEGGPSHMSLQGGNIDHKDAGPHDSMSHSKAVEHESMKKRSEAPHSAMQVKSKTEHEESDEHGDGHIAPHGKKIMDETDHTALSGASMSDDDGDDDHGMVEHMIGNMSDHDKDHAMESKPKTLGERVRHHALLKSKHMGKN